MAQGKSASKGSRSGISGGRGVSRGGIQKRKSGPVRVDKDGDLVMDAASAGVQKNGKARSEATKNSNGRPSNGSSSNTGPTRGGRISQRAQQAIIRGLGAQGVQSGKGRGRDVAAGMSYLSVRGLRQSKAASNPDRGVSALLSFLERKASGLDVNSTKGVQVKKVCTSPWLYGCLNVKKNYGLYLMRELSCFPTIFEGRKDDK
jgi:nuclear RNA export factor